MKLDIAGRLREQLEEIPVPSLWADVKNREPSKPTSGRGTRARIGIIGLALVVAAAGSWTAVEAFFGGSPSQRSASRMLSVSARAELDPVQCTVTLLTPSVQVGDTVQTTFGYQNTGTDAYRLPIDGGTPRLLVYAADGELLYDTDSGPYAVAGIDAGSDLEQVMPGETLERSSNFVALWPGDLTLKPLCGYGIPDEERTKFVSQGTIELPPLMVQVKQTKGGLQPGVALDRVLAETGGLFDRCRPGADGRAVTGVIPPPADWHGVQVPPLEATCAARIRGEQGALVIDLVFASPSSLSLPLSPGEGSTRGLKLPVGKGVEVGRWTFVVKAGDVREVTPTAAGRLLAESMITGEPEGLGSAFRGPRGCDPPSCRAIQFDLVDGQWIARDGVLLSSVAGELMPGIYFFAPDAPG